VDKMKDAFSVYRCHTIMNCTAACPKVGWKQITATNFTNQYIFSGLESRLRNCWSQEIRWWINHQTKTPDGPSCSPQSCLNKPNQQNLIFKN
jgi:hypothetical protein